MNIGESRKLLFKDNIYNLINEPLLVLTYKSATGKVIEPIRCLISLPVYNVINNVSFFLTSVSLR